MYDEAHFMLGNAEVCPFWKFLDYQVRGEDTAPVNVFCPVYDPASEIVPGTAIPQNVWPVAGVEVLVGFGIWLSKVPGVDVGCSGVPEP